MGANDAWTSVQAFASTKDGLREWIDKIKLSSSASGKLMAEVRQQLGDLWRCELNEQNEVLKQINRGTVNGEVSRASCKKKTFKDTVEHGNDKLFRQHDYDIKNVLPLANTLSQDCLELSSCYPWLIRVVCVTSALEVFAKADLCT